MLYKYNLDRTQLKQEMLKTALEFMTGYQTDLVYDFESIDEITDDVSRVWMLRETGTGLYSIPYLVEHLKDLKSYYSRAFKINKFGDTWSIVEDNRIFM